MDLPTECFALDGEIMVATPLGADFEALLARLHPTASRVERLRAETPALLIAFDLVALESRDLRGCPFLERRALLVELLANASGRATCLRPHAPLH